MMSLLTLYMWSNNTPLHSSLPEMPEPHWLQSRILTLGWMDDGQHITSQRSTNNSFFCCCMSDIVILPALQVAVMSLTARPPGGSSFRTKYDIARMPDNQRSYSQPRLDPALKTLRPMRKEMWNWINSLKTPLGSPERIWHLELCTEITNHQLCGFLAVITQHCTSPSLVNDDDDGKYF